MAVTNHSVESLRDDARRSASDARATLSEAASAGKDMAAAEYDRLRQGVDELLQLVKQAGADSTEKAREAVKARPVTALAGAFAVGFVAAMLLRR